MLKVRLLALGASAVTAIAVTGFAVAAPAGASVANTPSWQIVKSVTGPNFPQFEAVTAASASSAWAFESQGNGAPRAYELSGGSWTQKSFPATASEIILPGQSAASSSSSNVWVVGNNFTNSHSTAFYFNGSSWKAQKTFKGLYGAPLAISKTDVWLFGTSEGSPVLAEHFNGHSWAAASGTRGLLGASALSASNVWAFGSTSVSHLTGGGWKSTSLKSVLPKNSELCSSRLTGIAAISTHSVFVAATGGCQDQGGPFVLLHYNGSSWSRLALKSALGAPEAIASDGNGGVWIPVGTGAPVSGSMEHYSNGTLSSVKLPLTPAHLVLFDVAIGARTKTAYAVGFSRKSFTSATSTAVIFGYGA